MELLKAIEIVRKHGFSMLTQPNSGISAIAVGCKDGRPITEGKDFSLIAFVPRKMSRRELENSQITSFNNLYCSTTGEGGLPHTDIDVVESGSLFAPIIGLNVPVAQRGKFRGRCPILNTRKKFNSLRCGIGITNPVGSYPYFLSVGTAGFFMRDNDDNKYVVSNNHVIGRCNAANQGDSVIQPGSLDLTETELNMMPNLLTLERELKIAELSALIDIEYQTRVNIPVNFVDVAIAKLNNERDQSELSKLAYGGCIRGVANSFQVDDNNGGIIGNSKVFKVGRTTGYTEVVVIGIEGTATLDYDGNSAYFAGQIIVQPTPENEGPFSTNGDSGSGVFNGRNELIGLLFAGSERQTLVNPIDDVLNELHMALRPDLSVITG